MKNLFLISLVLLLPLFSSGQVNLVPNPNFEDTFRCSLDSTVIKAKYWYNPTICGSPDYFYPTIIGNPACNSQLPIGNFWGGGAYSNNWGYQLPHSGLAYVGGGFLESSESIACYLLDSMRTGKKYAVSFYASLANHSRSGMDVLNFCFMKDSVVDYNPLTCWTYINNLHADAGNKPFNFLLDTAGWMLVRDTFTALGQEQYMVFTGIDTVNDHYYLLDSANPSRAAYYYLDDFDVHCIDCFTPSDTSSEIQPFLLYPNPSSGLFYLEYTVPPQTVLEIFDVLGQRIKSVGLLEDENKTSFNLTEFAAGIYVWRVRAGEEVLHTGKLVLSNDAP